MTAVQMTEAGKPAPVDFRGRAGSCDHSGAGTAAGLRERFLVPVLGLCLLVATTAYLMVFTLLRQIGESVHASAASLSWITIAAVITGTVSSALLPALGSVVGQRRLMVGSLSCLAVGSVLSASAPDAGVLIAGRVIASLGLAAAALSIAIVREHRSGPGLARALGGIAAFEGVAAATGFALGGAVEAAARSDWRAVFLAMAALSAVAGVLAAVAIPDGPARVTDADERRRTSTPATTIPATTIPATTIPATTIPATTIPATTMPATTIPATTTPATTTPAMAPSATKAPAASVPAASVAAARRHVDIPGALLLAFGLAAVLLPVTEGNTWGWASPRVTILLAVAAILVAAWAVTAVRSADPLVRLRILSRPGVAAGVVLFLLTAATVAIVNLTVPSFLEAPPAAGYGAGASVLGAGLDMLPFAATITIAGYLAGRLAQRVRPQVIAVAGLCLEALALGLLAGFHHSQGQVIVLVAIFGAGHGALVAAEFIAITRTVRAADAGAASGLGSAVSGISGAVATAVITAVLAGRLIRAGHESLPAVGGYDQAWLCGAALAAVGAALTAVLAIRSGRPEEPRSVRYDAFDLC
jgi:MFS family permease